MTKKEIVVRILAHKASPFKTEDATVLEGFSEARLLEIETKLGPVEVPKAAAAGVTREQVLELFPDIATVVSEHQEREAARRGELVGALKTLGAFSEEELTAMPLGQLEKTAKAVAAVQPKTASAKPKVDFSGLGAPRSAAADPEVVPAPPNLKERLMAARGPVGVVKSSQAS